MTTLREQIDVRGVKLSELASTLDEAYGNLYTALKMEAEGREIRHKAVKARLEKVRDWLDTEQKQETRLASISEGSVGNRLRKKQLSRAVRDGHTQILDWNLGNGTTLSPGSVIKVSEHHATEWFQAGTYQFWRAMADEHGTIYELDLWGGPGRGDKQFSKLRTIRPEILGFPDRNHEDEETS